MIDAEYRVICALRERSVRLSRTGVEGEYRVNYIGGQEPTAYYTDDLEDALATGLAMANQRDAA